MEIVKHDEIEETKEEPQPIAENYSTPQINEMKVGADPGGVGDIDALIQRQKFID